MHSTLKGFLSFAQKLNAFKELFATVVTRLLTTATFFNLSYYQKALMTNNKDSSMDGSLRTTKTMRQKAQAISHCVLDMLKIWRLCCRKKGTEKKTD